MFSVKVPVISPVAAGTAVTVTVFVTGADAPETVYVITDEPTVNPVITPVFASTVATAGVALVKVPPVVVLENVVVFPTMTLSVPVNGAIVIGGQFYINQQAQIFTKTNAAFEQANTATPTVIRGGSF